MSTMTIDISAARVDHFARLMNAAARSAPRDARFGRKVFLGYLLEAMCLPPTEFDRLVIEANRRDLLEASRADMPPDFYGESALYHRETAQTDSNGRTLASFHFVVPR